VEPFRLVLIVVPNVAMTIIVSVAMTIGLMALKSGN
jgi:hypothetical protein